MEHSAEGISDVPGTGMERFQAPLQQSPLFGWEEDNGDEAIPGIAQLPLQKAELPCPRSPNRLGALQVAVPVVDEPSRAQHIRRKAVRDAAAVLRASVLVGCSSNVREPVAVG
jgi:hypothetical protein